MVPELTIGLSIYNPGALLEPALQSIFAQTLRDWELIVVDDGSDDGSTELLSLIRDPRVRVLKSGPRLGLAARLNQIAQAARAPYIARMDADDMLDIRRFEWQVSYLRAHPDIDVVGCGLVIVDNRGKPTGLRLFSTDHASICRDPLQGIELAHPTVVGKTAWFRKHPYNEENRSCEDWELWFNTYDSSKFANLRCPFYYYREFVPLSIGKYIEAKIRIAGLEWGQRANFGLLRTGRACLLQYVRILLNLFAVAVGLQHHMVRHRSSPINDDICACVLASAEEISKHAIPRVASSAVKFWSGGI